MCGPEEVDEKVDLRYGELRGASSYAEGLRCGVGGLGIGGCGGGCGHVSVRRGG